MKLTEMKSRDIFTSKTTPEDVEKIVFSGDNLSKNQAHNNVAVLLGGPGMIPYRADKGIWLYEEQKVEKVLVSGGIGYLNTDRTTPEAFKMRDYLLSQGIPDKDILVEPFSRSTIENMANSLAILEGLLYNLNETELTVVTSDFHLRRSMGLLINALGNSTNVYGAGSKDGVTDIDSWQNTFAGRKQIMQEALLLIKYAKEHRIPDMEIEGPSLKRHK
ncbi:MAG TPA: YdcF family protein [Candidatus Onthocola stercorigallinarum]|jgi:uncharacterized SAM-binding protein YcdF (DUF218 family)|nr:YdcF family protein [Candidatus Onthocola stercorigallinarum]